MSYGGDQRGTWDGGPPGAEADYSTSYQQPVAGGSEQWSSSSYSQYPSYSYPTAYGYAQPAYSYDPNYYASYTHADYTKYPSSTAYGQYTYDKSYAAPPPARRSRTPIKSRLRSRSRSRRSSSRSITPPRRARKYSRKSSSSSRSSSHSRSGYKRKISRRRSSSRSSRSRSHRRSYSRTPPKSHKYLKRRSTSIKRKERTPERKLVRTPERVVVKIEKIERSKSPIPKKHRESSVEIPRSYKVKRHSSSESSSSSSHTKPRSVSPKRKSLRTPSRSRSSSRHSVSRSRSSSRSRRVKKRTPSPLKPRRKRHTSSRSTSPPGLSESSTERTPPKQTKKTKRESRSRSSSPKKSQSGSPKSGSSSDSTRGHFDTQDRKKYFKRFNALKEAAKKEKDKVKVDVIPDPIKEEFKKIEEEEIVYKEPSPVKGINFEDLPPPPSHARFDKPKPSKLLLKNDGSFLEMFKKMQEQAKKEVAKKEEEVKPKTEMKKPALPFIGKRRGGKILKTGLVKKAKSIEEQLVDNTPKDAWSLYMQEVKKYRETSCEEERKTRPLVK